MASNLVNPTTLSTFSRIRSAGGATTQARPDFLNECRTLAGAVAISAPVAAGLPDGACFAVEDTDGNAAANNITIAGGATLIDGAASLVLSANSAIAVLVLDGGQWRRVLVERSIASSPLVFGRSAEQPSQAVTSVTMGGDVTGLSSAAVVEKVRGVAVSAVAPTAGQVLTASGAANAAWAAASGGLPDLPSLLLSIVNSAAILGTATAAGETHGYRFLPIAPMTVSGVRICSGPTGNGKTFKVQLWSQAGVSLASASATSTANNEIMTIPFASPVSLGVLTNAANFYMVSVFCSSAGYSVFTPATLMPPAAAWPFLISRDVLFKTFSYAGGDNWPGTAITTEHYALEPVMTRT